MPRARSSSGSGVRKINFAAMAPVRLPKDGDTVSHLERSSSLAGDASRRVHSIISAAEQEAASLCREAERDADSIRRYAEDDGEQILADARGHADDLVRERMRRLSELSDKVVECTEMLVERMEGTGHVKRQLETLISALGDAAEAVAREAGRAAARRETPPPRRETAPPWRESVPPPAPARPARRVAQGTAQPAPPPARPTPETSRPPAEPARLSAPKREERRFARSPEPPSAPIKAERAEKPAEPARGRDDEIDSQFDGARLVALQMAVAGSTREEVEAELQRAFRLPDPSAILDDVFGEGGPRRASVGDHRKTGRSPATRSPAEL